MEADKVDRSDVENVVNEAAEKSKRQ